MGFLGDKLRLAREGRNVTLTEAAAATKIKLEYLRALEEERFDELPSPTYARGFLKIYSHYLKLEPEPLLRAYIDSYHPSAPQVALVERKRVPAIPLLPGIKWELLLPLGVGIVVLVLILIGLLNLIRGGRPASPASRKFSAIDNPYTSGTIEKIKLPDRQALPPEFAPELKLEVRSKEDVLLKVHVDGSLIFFDTLKAAATYRWSARRDFRIRVPHSGKVVIIFQGEEVKFPPAASFPLDISLTAEGIRFND